jgi:hypothetical protein
MAMCREAAGRGGSEPEGVVMMFLPLRRSFSETRGSGRLMDTSSTSKCRTELAGIGPTAREPYPKAAGMMSCKGRPHNNKQSENTVTADVECVARNEARGKSTHLAFAANIHSHHTLIPEAHIHSDQLIN